MNGIRRLPDTAPRQDHLRPRKPYCFRVQVVVKRRSLPKHRIAQRRDGAALSQLSRKIARAAAETFPIRARNRVPLDCREESRAVEVALSRNRARAARPQTGWNCLSEPRQIDRQNAKSCLIE